MQRRESYSLMFAREEFMDPAWGCTGCEDCVCVFSEYWNLGCHTGASSLLHVFRIGAVMLSGPVDSGALRCWKAQVTDISTFSCTVTELSTSPQHSAVLRAWSLMKKVWSSATEASTSLVTSSCLLGMPAMFVIVSQELLASNNPSR